MKDRLITIAGGLLAFALVVILLVPAQQDDAAGISRPLSTDRGRAGLQGLNRWLEQSGVETAALRRRYTALVGDFELSPRGNLLIVSLPQQVPSSLEEHEALRGWLARGNHALVLVAAGDAPRWTLLSSASSIAGFLEFFGFELKTREAGGDDRAPAEDKYAEGDPPDWPPLTDREAWLEGESVRLVPRFRHPLTREVTAVSARSRRPRDRGWVLTGIGGARAVLPLLGEVENGAAFWETRVGDGRLWLSRYSDLFANVGLGAADNARFMANLVDSAVAGNGRVILDDMHQGETDLYDASAFFSDPRFVNTMSFVVGFWLLYLIGRSRRLAPARDAAPRYYSADLARAMAGFFVRRLSIATVERQLFVFFFNEIRARYGLPTNGQPVWSMLSGMSRVSADDISGLRAHYERLAAGKQSDLVATARLMQRTRECLL